MKLLIGTNNAGKATEIAECLRDTPIELITPKDLEEEIAAPPETGSSFAENAIQKARHYHVFTGLPTIADDSGIEVDALAGELGVHTRRWGAGPQASDEEWIAYFLKRMKEDVKEVLKGFECGILLEGQQDIKEGDILQAYEITYLEQDL